MKKIFHVFMLAAFLIVSFSFSASASVFYVSSDLDARAELRVISKDSSGNLTESVIFNDLAADSTVFAFKHNGQSRLLMSSLNTNKMHLT